GAAATTKRAGSTARAAPAAARSRAEAPRSCAPPGLRGEAQAAADHRAGGRRAQTRMQREQQFGRRVVGAMNGEAPAELVGLGTDFRAVTRHAGLVFALPSLGAAGGDRARAFRLDELNAAGIGKGLFRRIDDLHGMAMGAGGGELRERGAHLRDGAPE